MKRILRKIKRTLIDSKYGHKGKFVTIRNPIQVIGKKNMYIGDSVRFLDNARIETVSFWRNQTFVPKLSIGENTTFEQNAHIIACGDLSIGSNCVFSAFVYVSDCNHVLDVSNWVMDNPLEYKNTKIGDYCFVGIGARIMPGVHLGNHCVVGANSVVTKSFPDYSMVAGNPARLIKKFDPQTKQWIKVEE